MAMVVLKLPYPSSRQALARLCLGSKNCEGRVRGQWAYWGSTVGQVWDQSRARLAPPWGRLGVLLLLQLQSGEHCPTNKTLGL